MGPRGPGAPMKSFLHLVSTCYGIKKGGLKGERKGNKVQTIDMVDQLLSAMMKFPFHYDSI